MVESTSIYLDIPGGREIVEWFGIAPTFHDAEIVSLDLRRRAASRLRLHYWRRSREVDEHGHYVLDRHAVITFILQDILDLQLDGFSPQNVVFGLILKRAPPRPDRKHFCAFDPSPNDYELELEPCYGLNGLIRCRKVSVELTLGKPEDAC